MILNRYCDCDVVYRDPENRGLNKTIGITTRMSPELYDSKEVGVKFGVCDCDTYDCKTAIPVTNTCIDMPWIYCIYCQIAQF